MTFTVGTEGTVTFVTLPQHAHTLALSPYALLQKKVQLDTAHVYTL